MMRYKCITAPLDVSHVEGSRKGYEWRGMNLSEFANDLDLLLNGAADHEFSDLHRRIKHALRVRPRSPAGSIENELYLDESEVDAVSAWVKSLVRTADQMLASPETFFEPEDLATEIAAVREERSRANRVYEAMQAVELMAA